MFGFVTIRPLFALAIESFPKDNLVISDALTINQAHSEAKIMHHDIAGRSRRASTSPNPSPPKRIHNTPSLSTAASEYAE
jgi:hypothetical protein